MDISDLKVELEDIKTICLLIRTTKHLQVGSLTTEQVKQLDRTASVMGLDYNLHKYLERSRYKSEAVVVIRATLYGKSRY